MIIIIYLLKNDPFFVDAAYLVYLFEYYTINNIKTSIVSSQ